MRIEIELTRDNKNPHPKDNISFKYYRGNAEIDIILGDREVSVAADDLFRFLRLASE